MTQQTTYLARTKMKIYAIITATILVTSCASAGDLSRDIANLDANSYEQRELAVANLTKAGEAALPVLMEIARTGNEESKWRAFRAIKLIVGDDAKLQEKTITIANEKSLPWLASRLAPKPDLTQAPISYSAIGFGSSGIIVRPVTRSIPIKGFRTLKAPVILESFESYTLDRLSGDLVEEEIPERTDPIESRIETRSIDATEIKKAL